VAYIPTILSFVLTSHATFYGVDYLIINEPLVVNYIKLQWVVAVKQVAFAGCGLLFNYA